MDKTIILDIMRKYPNWHFTDTDLAKGFMSDTPLKRIQTTIDKLVETKQILKTESGYTLPGNQGVLF